MRGAMSRRHQDGHGTAADFLVGIPEQAGGGPIPGEDGPPTVGKNDRVGRGFHQRTKPCLAFRERVFGMFDLGGQGLHAHGALKDGAQLVAIVRFRQVGEGALRQRAHRAICTREGRENDDWQVRVRLLQALEHRRSVAVGQPQVEEDGVVLVATRLCEGLRATAGDTHLIPVVVEKILQPEHDVGVVIDDQNGAALAGDCHDILPSPGRLRP